MLGAYLLILVATATVAVIAIQVSARFTRYYTSGWRREDKTRAEFERIAPPEGDRAGPRNFVRRGLGNVIHSLTDTEPVREVHRASEGSARPRLKPDPAPPPAAVARAPLLAPEPTRMRHAPEPVVDDGPGVGQGHGMQCPACHGRVLATARVCRHCGQFLVASADG